MASYDDEDEDNEKADPTDVADNIISDGVSDVVHDHGQNETPYVDKDIIRVQYDLSHRDAAAVKTLVWTPSERRTNRRRETIRRYNKRATPPRARLSR